MIVVSDTSPIINLAAVGQLELLHKLYDEIAIPQAVYHEIVVIGAGQPGATEVEGFEWIKKQQVVNQTLVASLKLELDPGEAEAIALATELPANLLLLDERRRRLIASRLGLKVIGILGLMVEAKHRGFVSTVKPIMNDLISKAGF